MNLIYKYGHSIYAFQQVAEEKMSTWINGAQGILPT